MVGLLIFVVFVSIIMMSVAFSIKVENNNTNMETLFILGMTITLFCMFTLGGYWFYKQEHKVKYQIKPSIEIMIKDGKADTTYIYKFKEEK